MVKKISIVCYITKKLLLYCSWLIWPIQNEAKKLENDRNPGIWVLIMKVLNESYPINTNMTGFRCFSKTLCPCALDESCLSIRRIMNIVKISILNCIVKMLIPTLTFVFLVLFILLCFSFRVLSFFFFFMISCSFPIKNLKGEKVNNITFG